MSTIGKEKGKKANEKEKGDRFIFPPPFDKPVLSEPFGLRQAQTERRVEGPVLSAVEGPVLSEPFGLRQAQTERRVEGPVLSAVEGLRANGINQTFPILK